MKVLKKGRKQEGWTIEVKCTGSGNGGGGCGALLLVSEGDLYNTHHYDYGGGHDVFVTLRCTECKVQTDLPRNNWPPANIYVRKSESASQKPEPK